MSLIGKVEVYRFSKILNGKSGVTWFFRKLFLKKCGVMWYFRELFFKSGDMWLFRENVEKMELQRFSLCWLKTTSALS